MIYIYIYHNSNSFIEIFKYTYIYIYVKRDDTASKTCQDSPISSLFVLLDRKNKKKNSFPSKIYFRVKLLTSDIFSK